MNKIFSIALLCSAALSFTACVNEEDDLFDKSAAERLNEASDLYSKRLMASPNGWAVQLYPTKQDEAPYGTGYLLMFRFHANKSVDASMNNALSNNNYMTDTSTWEVITDNGPVLSFNTYNKVVHTFSDPEDVPSTGTQDTPNDETGTGIGGDYEFIIVDAPEDASYMMLKGKKRGTYNLLTPVEEGVDFESYLADVKSFQSTMFPASSPTFDVVHVGDAQYKMIDFSNGVPNIYPYDGDPVMDQTFNPFLVTKRGNDYYLRFRDAKSYDDGVAVQDFKYDTEKDVFQSVDREDCYIDGDDPLRFFNQRIATDHARLQLLYSADNSSASMKEITDAINTGLKAVNKSYSLVGLYFLYDESTAKYYLRVQYGRSNVADYEFSYTKEADGVTFGYVQPKNNVAQNVMGRVAAIQTLLNNMSTKFTVGGLTTKFNLGNEKLTSTTDANFWFGMAI